MNPEVLLQRLQLLWLRWRSPAQPQLLTLLPGGEPKLTELIPGRYRLGRDSGCEVVIDHSAVSREHALLEQRSEAWLLRDNHSTNGLWWQGRRIQE
ncbi:MAG: FHA domain-containing protein, partial [Cyanobacteria bacterium M_surface_9_m1_291]|nr:FHA domain-containing protein [Cyanobacteria bacterium M_surface_9_m1_291]